MKVYEKALIEKSHKTQIEFKPQTFQPEEKENIEKKRKRNIVWFKLSI